MNNLVAPGQTQIIPDVAAPAEQPAVTQQLEATMANWAQEAFKGDADPEVAAVASEKAATPQTDTPRAGTEVATPTAPQQAPDATDGQQPPRTRAQELLNDPEVQALINGTLQQQSPQEQQALAQQQWEEYLEQLPPEQYKEYTLNLRKHMASQAQLQEQMENQMATRFYVDGYQQVINTVPELKSLPAEVAQKVQTANTYGEAIQALVDRAATVRAEKLAKDIVKTEVEAFKADWTSKAAGSFGIPPSQAAGRVGTGKDIPFDPNNGTAMLVAAFSDN
jgi:hypothetical protein